jgi:hypothetical protein
VLQGVITAHFVLVGGCHQTIVCRKTFLLWQKNGTLPATKLYSLLTLLLTLKSWFGGCAEPVSMNGKLELIPEQVALAAVTSVPKMSLILLLASIVMA